MNDEEIRSTLEQIKAQVKAKEENKDKTDDEIDEMILDAFFKAYTEGDLSKEDLGALAGAMGYEFTEEFAAEEDTPAEGGDNTPAPAADEAPSQEELEDIRTIEPGESTEEFKDKIEEAKGEEDGDTTPAPEAEEEVEEETEEEEEGDEDDERKRASELFKMDLSKK